MASSVSERTCVIPVGGSATSFRSQPLHRLSRPADASKEYNLVHASHGKFPCIPQMGIRSFSVIFGAQIFSVELMLAVIIPIIPVFLALSHGMATSPFIRLKAFWEVDPLCPQLTWRRLSHGTCLIQAIIYLLNFSNVQYFLSWNSLMSVCLSVCLSLSLCPLPPHSLQPKFWCSESISLFCCSFSYPNVACLPRITERATQLFWMDSWYPFGRKSLLWGSDCAFRVHCLWVCLGGAVARKCELPSVLLKCPEQLS